MLLAAAEGRHQVQAKLFHKKSIMSTATMHCNQVWTKAESSLSEWIWAFKKIIIFLISLLNTPHILVSYCSTYCFLIQMFIQYSCKSFQRSIFIILSILITETCHDFSPQCYKNMLLFSASKWFLCVNLLVFFGRPRLEFQHGNVFMSAVLILSLF